MVPLLSTALLLLADTETFSAEVTLSFRTNATGRRFDGVGGLSGGGATSSAQPPELSPLLTTMSVIITVHSLEADALRFVACL